MSDATFPAIATAIKKLTGLHIEPEKYYLFEHRFTDVMREYKLTAYGDLLAAIEQGSDRHFLSRVIENITTHETRFFRDESILRPWRSRLFQNGKKRMRYRAIRCNIPNLKYFLPRVLQGKKSIRLR